LNLITSENTFDLTAGNTQSRTSVLRVWCVTLQEMLEGWLCDKCLVDQMMEEDLSM